MFGYRPAQITAACYAKAINGGLLNGNTYLVGNGILGTQQRAIRSDNRPKPAPPFSTAADSVEQAACYPPPSTPSCLTPIPCMSLIVATASDSTLHGAPILLEYPAQ
jgi:hypothetical protein